MNNWKTLVLLVSGVFSYAANADVIGANAGIDFWYSDTKINGVKANDAKMNQSIYASFEHFIPLIPNAKLRYTPVESAKFNTKFDQYDFIAYYELLDSDLLSLDAGINLQHFNGKFQNRGFQEWQPNLYADGRIIVPGLPLTLFATFSYGDFLKSSTVDAETGVLYSMDLALASLNFKAGYRIMDHQFKYFPVKADIQNDGFFLGVEIDI